MLYYVRQICSYCLVSDGILVSRWPSVNLITVNIISFPGERKNKPRRTWNRSGIDHDGIIRLLLGSRKYWDKFQIFVSDGKNITAYIFSVGRKKI